MCVTKTCETLHKQSHQKNHKLPKTCAISFPNLYDRLALSLFPSLNVLLSISPRCYGNPTQLV